MRYAKKVTVSFVLSLILLWLAMCAGAEAPHGTDTTFEEAMRAYAAVLQNESEFYCADGGDYYDPAEGRFTLLHEYTESFEPPYLIETFAVIDLDQDGIPEVVLSMLYENFLEVLYYDVGTVYGYLFPIRAMIGLKQDGTFGFSSGAADSGYGRLMFTPPDYAYVEIESSGADEAVVWHEYTSENIETYIQQ